MFKPAILSLFAAALMLAVNLGCADEMKMQKDTGNAKVQIHKGHGVVNKINGATGIVNIDHDAIASLKWPGMTMDFTVQDKAGLAAIKPGMAVDFEITMQGSNYRITRIMPAR